MKKQAIYMETTKKSPETTAGEIQNLLKNYNLKSFSCTYEIDERKKIKIL